MLNVSSSIARSIANLEGWPRTITAFLAGLASVLAMAPFYLAPVLFLTFPILVLLIDGTLKNVDRTAGDNPKPKLLQRAPLRVALIGWWFAFGYFTGGLYWIGHAFLVEADKFAWLLPIAVTAMPAGLALFWAAAVGLAALVWRPGLLRVLVLAVALSGFEWLRGHVLSGFPWNVPGYALTYPLPLMQMSGLVGIYGLTLIALLVFTAPLVILGDGVHLGPDETRFKPQRNRLTLTALAIGVVPILAMVGYGYHRLNIPQPGTVAGVKIRIVQPSILQTEKWRPEHQKRIFDLHLSLSRQNAAGKTDELRNTTLLIWPEAAMPFLPLREPKALQAIAKLLPKGSHLFAGALTVQDAVAGLPWSKRKIFNTILVFDSDARMLSKYDKTHLVPFGEYLPFQSALEALGLEQLTRIRGGFNTGPSPRPILSIPGVPAIGPLICYEIIFPGIGTQSAARPALIINLTNDGWFGNTTGPRQHMHQARVRAVEEGIPVIRSANNGISAVVDAYGRMLHSLGMNEVGVIDTDLPKRIVAPLYSRLGDIVFGLMWLICLAVVGIGSYRFGLQKPFNHRA